MAGLLSGSRSRRLGLCELLDSSDIVLAPGCYDALDARLADGSCQPSSPAPVFRSRPTT